MESVEAELVELLRRADLQGFDTILAAHQITKVKHLEAATDEELKALGIFSAAVRRLRNEIHVQTAFKYIDSIPRVSVKIHSNHRLGSGQFGTVYKAIWKKDECQTIECAVKSLNENASPEVNEEFCKEMTSMQRLAHSNIVRFFGVILDMPIFMVMEYCDGGALVDRLKNSNRPLLLTTMINYAEQIVDGMCYLASQKVVHRDLAARNILLTKGEKVVKIGDLGLARIVYDNTYVQVQRRKLPIAWTAPEALFNRLFSHASDVWAFGVTLWEMFSYGEEPWSTFSPTELANELRKGAKLRRTPRCPTPIYELMLKCWRDAPESRPEFSQLKEDLPKTQFEIYECLELYQNIDYDILPATKLMLVTKISPDLFYVQNLSNARFIQVPSHVLKRIEDISLFLGNKGRSSSFSNPSKPQTEKKSQTYFSSTDNEPEMRPQKKELSKKLPQPPSTLEIPRSDFNLKVSSQNSDRSETSSIADSGCEISMEFSQDTNFSRNTSFASSGYRSAESIGRSVSMENLGPPKKPPARLEPSTKPKFFVDENNPNVSRENLLAELSKRVEKPILLPPQAKLQDTSSESVLTSHSAQGVKKSEKSEIKEKTKTSKPNIFEKFNFNFIKTPSTSTPSVTVTTPSPTTSSVPRIALPSAPRLPPKSETNNKIQKRPTRRQFDRNRRKSMVKSGGGYKAVAVVKEMIEETETAVISPTRPTLPKKPNSGATTFPASNTPSNCVFPPPKRMESTLKLPTSPPPPPLPRTTSSQPQDHQTSQNTFIRKPLSHPLPPPPRLVLKPSGPGGVLNTSHGQIPPPPLPSTPAPIASKKREIARGHTDTQLNASSASLIQDMQRKLNMQGLNFNLPLQPSTSSSSRSLPPSPDTNRRPRPALLPKPPKHGDTASSNMLNRSHPVLPLPRSDMPPKLPSTPNSAPPVPPRRSSTRSMNGFVPPKRNMEIAKPLSPIENKNVIKFRELTIEIPKTTKIESRISTDSWTEPDEDDEEDMSKQRAKLGGGKQKKKKGPYAKADLARGPGRATIKKKEKQKKILEETLKLDIQKRLNGETGLSSPTSPKIIKENESKLAFFSKIFKKNRRNKN
uniref:Protein kinase domain-containing protein n=1 Tax=Acrobeloides nanus TaxID=290746 RepID=A0A914DQH8_9BILA